jgi:hypothetical protein
MVRFVSRYPFLRFPPGFRRHETPSASSLVITAPSPACQLPKQDSLFQPPKPPLAESPRTPNPSPLSHSRSPFVSQPTPQASPSFAPTPKSSSIRRPLITPKGAGRSSTSEVGNKSSDRTIVVVDEGNDGASKDPVLDLRIALHKEEVKKLTTLVMSTMATKPSKMPMTLS